MSAFLEVDSRYDYHRTGFISSVIGHLLLLAFLILRLGGSWGEFKPPVIYSVTIEGGKTLGGKAQVAKKDDKTPIAPPKNIKNDPVKEEKKAEEKKPDPKKDKVEPEKAKDTVKIPDKKEIEKPKKDEKKKPKEETPEEINKRLQSAMQRYLGESSDAGAKGFGAASLGAKGMGGGVVRPPEFFAYLKKLEEYIKAGWIWSDNTAPLIAQVTFDMSPDGRLSSITLVKGSGSGGYDDSVMRAIYKASPVPPPPTSVYEYFRSVRMTFDPRE